MFKVLLMLEIKVRIGKRGKLKFRVLIAGRIMREKKDDSNFQKSFKIRNE